MAKPRSSWKGSIAFGILNVPVRLVKATDDKDIHFKLLHEKDHGAIKMPRTCGTCEATVDSAEIVRGYEIDSEHVVIFTEEELDELPVGSLDTIRLTALDSPPDPVRIDSSYFVVPEKTGAKALSILAAAMKKSKKSLQGAVTIRRKERPCWIWLRENGMVLSTLRFPNEVRELEDYEVEAAASKDEIAMAQELLAMLSGDPLVHDAYAEAVLFRATQKAQGELIQPQPKKTQAAPTTDILAALKASVDEARKGKKKIA